IDWWIGKQFALNPALLKDFRPVVHEFLAEAFSHAEGDTFEERLNHDYLRTRNRSHFGHIRQGAVGNEISIHLSSAAYVLQASRLIPFEEKATGGLVRDLFRLAPELQRYPFENEDWNQRLGTSPQLEIDFTGESWGADLDANAASTPPRLVDERWQPRPGR